VQPAAAVDVLLLARAGAAFGAIPPQHLFLPAGSRTLPGHAASALAGSRFVAGGVELAHHLTALPLTLHAGAHAAAVTGRHHAPAEWDINRSARLRSSATVGVGLFSNLARLDFAHGVRGRGEWRLLVNPALAPLL
jgi:hypothetical protein